MNHVEPLSVLRTFRAPSMAVVLAMSLGAAQAAQTDIASTPIVTTSAALVKPNIMLLMDASGSMARTHMPDEAETLMGPNSVGYKSMQCNPLYYNPGQVYFLPKRYDGSLFPLPSYGSAPYAGFGSYYAVPDLSTTNLATQFVAFDAATLEFPPPFPDTPQPAYYYVYTGTQTLTYAGAPCTDFDTGANRPATGGGNWTKVVVNGLTAAEQQNFAIWYSYYRTRLSLIKSAASLAFAPLNDTKRIGFITVQPKATPASPTINPVRYLPLGDFNSTQKDLWFTKLFSQRAGGASPAREGLARVGRYYAGKDDGINAGMPATGADDPIQYACQQNFTIMTTDGYWNGFTESTNVLGGGVNILGDAKVGQQDGDPTCPLSDPYCPRPIWDGVSGSTRVVTDKTNAYTDNVCSLASLYRQNFQTQREVTSTTKDATRTTERTVQFFEAKSQALATTTQTTFTHTYDFQTTEQFAKRREWWNEERYQHVQRQEQTTKVTEQYELQTTQVAAQEFQTREVKKQYERKREQWTTAKSQSVLTTTQYVMQTDQYKLGVKQVYKYQFQTIKKLEGEEFGEAIAGDCVPNPGVWTCEIRTVFANQLVDPSTCTPTGTTVGPGPGYLKTTCTDGPSARLYGPVNTCTPGFTAASSGNSWTETTCDSITVTPAAAFNGTCTPGTTQGAGPDFFLFICTRPAANNTTTPVASCPATTPAAAPDWITTTCSQPPGPNNFAATPSLPCTVGSMTDGSFVTTVCAKPMDTTDYVSACTPDDGLGSPFIKTTCTLQTLSDVPVASASCTPGTVEPVVTTCAKVAGGTYPTPTPVASCVDGATTGAPNFFETTCTNPAANNAIVFTTPAGCGPLGITAGTSPDWITRDCRKPAGVNNATAFSPPASCVPNDGSAPPYLKVTCSTVETMASIVVDPATCPFGTTVGPGPDYIVNHCEYKSYAPTTPVPSCVPVMSGPPDYVVTACGFASSDEPVFSCVPGPLPPEGAVTVTCVKPAGPNNAGPTQVATCTPAVASAPNYVHVTCAGPTTTAPVAVLPASCTGGPYFYPTYILTCSTSPIGPYPMATPVSSCTAGTDGSFVTTSCSYPAPTNYAATPTAPCTEGTTTEVGTEIKTTCSKTDTTVYVPTATCTNVAQVGTGPAITCTTTPTLGTPSVACSAGAVDPGPFFDTTTACNTTTTTPMSDYAGLCTPGPTGPPGESATCGLRALGGPVADAGCVAGTDAGTGVVTQCTPSGGSGHQYTIVTTTTVTTTPMSGTVPAGPDVVATSS
ncbi:MAG: hypothetical protein ACXWUL_00660, partial [Caldimonas sp.]